MRKILSAWGIILLMLVLVVGTAAAQSGFDGTPTPTTEPTSSPAGSTGYTHPIVQILSAYFGRTTRPMLPTPTPTATSTADPLVTPTATSTVDPLATPTATATAEPVPGPEDFAQQIAMYHEEGMGFGVLVKLYAMAEASVEACLTQQAETQEADPTQPACEAVSVDELVGEFQDGAGMGQLFKEYGKPALLGVGQVRKALQKEQAELQPTPTPVPSMASSDPQAQNQKVNNGSGSGSANNNGNGNSNGNRYNNGNGNKPNTARTPNPHKPKK